MCRPTINPSICVIRVCEFAYQVHFKTSIGVHVYVLPFLPVFSFPNSFFDVWSDMKKRPNRIFELISRRKKDEPVGKTEVLYCWPWTTLMLWFDDSNEIRDQENESGCHSRLSRLRFGWGNDAKTDRKQRKSINKSFSVTYWPNDRPSDATEGPT